MTLGDLNEDGKLDLATANYSNSTISVRFGDGLGGFGTASTFSASPAAYSLVLVDVNLDGHRDIASVSFGGNSISVRLGNGGGGFGAPSTIGVGTAPASIGTGEFNNDGHLDFVTVNQNSVSLIPGNGTGGFGPVTTVSIGVPLSNLIVGDFNGDYFDDVAVGRSTTSSISILLGNGAGALTPSSVVATGGNPVSLVSDDVNRDGRLDLISSNLSTTSVAGLSVLLGNGTGSFVTTPNIAVPAYGTLALSDLDNSGHLDLAVANPFAIVAPNVMIMTGDGQGRFSNIKSQSVGNKPYQVLLRDINGDGHLDLISGHNNGLSVALGNGVGSFANAIQYGGGGGVLGTVAVADMNLDGSLDLVTTVDGGEDVAVLLGNGSGTFGAPSFYTVGSPLAGSHISSLSVGNFNGDAFPDIATGNQGSPSSVSVIFHLPTGGYSTATNFSTGGSPHSVVMLDVNHDGRRDIIAANENNNTVTILYGNGLGGVSSSTNIPLGVSPFFVTARDINDDSWPDIITANYSASTVSIIMGNGSGGFASPTSVSAFGPASVAIGDINSDGKLDLAIPNVSPNNVAVRFGDGMGGFGSPQHFYVHAEPYSAALGDINEDGRTDIVTASYYTTFDDILLNKTDRTYGGVVLGTEPDAPPMPNVQIDALDPNSLTTIVASTLTDINGRFRFNSIPNGSWIIRASVIHVTPNITTISNYPDFDPTRRWRFLDNEALDSIPTIKFPNPVVLQSGLWAGLPATPADATWSTAVAYLSDDPAINTDKREHRIPAFLTYGHYTYDDDANDVSDHDANAILLNYYIDSIDFGPWLNAADRLKVKFNIIAHSMGGLITRSMVTQHPPESQIGRIVSLDSPHGGTTLARPAKPALDEEELNGLRQSSCGPAVRSGWNDSHLETGSTTRNWLLYSSTDPIVTPNDSAFGKGRPWVWPFYPDRSLSFADNACRIWSTPGWQVTVPNWHFGSSGIHSDINRLREFGLYLAKGILPVHNPLPVLGIPDPTDGLGALTDIVTAPVGGPVTRQIHFDSNSIIYGKIIRRGDQAQYSLTDSGGAPLIISNSVSRNITRTDIFDSFEIASPPNGTINIILQAGLVAAELQYSFYFDNGNSALPSVAPETIDAGNVVQIKGSLLDLNGLILQGANGVFNAVITAPGGGTQSIPLFDDGAHGDDLLNDGVFGAIFGGLGTTLKGRYTISVHGELSVGGSVVERSMHSFFSVNPTGGAFNGNISVTRTDTNVNSRYDWLNFDQPILLTEPGSFSFGADLLDSNGGIISSLHSSIDNSSSSMATTVRLSVSGSELNRHGVNGPWTLSNIRLVRLDAGSLPLATRSDITTAPYLLSTFELPTPPDISAVTPNHGSVRGGYDVVLMGSNFLGATEVKVCDKIVTFNVQDNQSVLLKIPRRAGIEATPCPVGQNCPTLPYNPISCAVKISTPWGFDQKPGAFIIDNGG